MFEWLEDEAASIRTRNFHQFAPVAVPTDSALPPSYIEFARRFGNARLYRKGAYYLVGVVCPPVAVPESSGELLRFGHYDSSVAFFDGAMPSMGPESPVFESADRHGKGRRRVADGFETWLLDRCKKARARYGEREWREVLSGPRPFTPEEADIVAARSKFNWRLEGFADDGDAIIRVANSSQRRLPFLTAGARAKDGSMDGRVWLKVGDIGPGEERLVRHPAYKGQIERGNIEFYPLPDPAPEDRDLFWEFRTTPQ